MSLNPMKGKAGKKGRNVIAAALVTGLLAAAAGYSLASVTGTKHNFGSLSPGEIKSGETTEVCVFCHTPHNANPSGPAWNKQDPGATYDVYMSQTLAATLDPNSPTLGQPTGSSKLCLACHDGTIAIGSLLNLPGKGLGGELSVTGAGIEEGKLSSISTSHIGTDLMDDHPISFEYSRSYPSNEEIRDPLSESQQRVKLDGAGMMQCTSCHDPHGTEFPKFLLGSLSNGGLCQICHDKRYWETNPSVHGTSTATWNGEGVNPWHEDLGETGYSDDTPEMQSCLACHRSHGGAAGKALLKGTNPSTSNIENEEWLCLNCHNGNVASKDLTAQFEYPYKHDVKATWGLHVPSREFAGDPARESAENLRDNRHAECADCHNPHGAMEGNQAMGGVNGNIIGANILGSWGVKPSSWPVAGEPVTAYEVVDFTSTNPGGNNLEGYLCIKCHSYYAYGSMPPYAPSGNADGSQVEQSDPTADFNINNMGFHPVFAQGRNVPPGSPRANLNWPDNGLGLTNTFRYVDLPETWERTGYYNVTHDSTITCSACHGSSVSSDPSGVHGSNEKWILKANTTGFGTTRNFCYNCHKRDVYGDEGYIGPNANYSRVSHPPDGLGTDSPFYKQGTGTGNNSNKFGILCLSCHGGWYDPTETVDQIKGIHGSNAPAGTLEDSDPLGYRLMNGACVESYKSPRTTGAMDGQITFRTITPSTEKVCNDSFEEIAIPGTEVNYDCTNMSDCSY
ncbi:MAG: cytochrome c3 family protein [Thermodesulfobacteriota bacterium]|nr:MAG: cytochrome c3 family protein [Thermodesulfobacteriota bacterium]